MEARRQRKPAPRKRETRESSTGRHALLDDSGELDSLDWRNVIWREWRNTEDSEFAKHLFDTVDDPKGIVRNLLSWRTLIVRIPWLMLGAGVSALEGVLASSYFGQQFGFVWAGFFMCLFFAGLWAKGPADWFKALYPVRQLCFWWRRRSTAQTLERALTAACRASDEARDLWKEPLERLAAALDIPFTPERLMDALRSNDWVERFIGRMSAAKTGGKAASALVELMGKGGKRVRGMALWLLRSIAQASRSLAGRAEDFLCPECLVRVDKNRVAAPRQRDFHYFGCRRCGRNHALEEWTGKVVAVLDAAMKEARVRDGDELRVNALAHGDVFDFDSVEIANATDEDVERFAMQVGNDVDDVRRRRYKGMDCAVAQESGVSEGAVRTLRSQFPRATTSHAA